MFHYSTATRLALNPATGGSLLEGKAVREWSRPFTSITVEQHLTPLRLVGWCLINYTATSSRLHHVQLSTLRIRILKVEEWTVSTFRICIFKAEERAVSTFRIRIFKAEERAVSTFRLCILKVEERVVSTFKIPHCTTSCLLYGE
jgi:hypothetical protein